MLVDQPRRGHRPRLRPLRSVPRDGHAEASVAKLCSKVMRPRRVILADDDVLLREALASLLDQHGFAVVGQAGTSPELLELVREHEPDLVIVDIRMPPSHTTEGLDAAQ